MRLLLSTLLLMVIGTTACFEAPSLTGPIPLEEEEFAPELEIELSEMNRNSSGLYWEDIEIGEGERAVVGDTVTFRYTGWLTNGEVIDTNEGDDDKSPFSMILGMSDVIPGIHEGIEGMRAGGERKLVIPAKLAWGPISVGSIPANANVVFRVRLLGINLEDIGDIVE